MKMNKKTIIILVVVAVTVYLLWKKRLFKTAGTNAAAGSSNDVNADSIESLIAASGMTSSDAAFVRNFRSSVEASRMLTEQIEIKAIQNGYTFEQQLVLDAIWSKYYDNNTSSFKEAYLNQPAVKQYVWNVQAAVKNA